MPLYAPACLCSVKPYMVKQIQIWKKEIGSIKCIEAKLDATSVRACPTHSPVIGNAPYVATVIGGCWSIRDGDHQPFPAPTQSRRGRWPLPFLPSSTRMFDRLPLAQCRRPCGLIGPVGR